MNLTDAISLACTTGADQLALRRSAGILEIFAFSSPRSIRVRCVSDGDDLDLSVPAKTARECVDTIGPSARLVAGKKGLRVQGDSGLSSMPSTKDTSWVQQMHHAPVEAVEFDVVGLQAAISRVGPARFHDPIRPSQYGVQLETRGRVIAMNGHALCYAPAPAGIDVYIPGESIATIMALTAGKVALSTTTSLLIVSTPDVTYQTSLVVDKFPEYERWLEAVKTDMEVSVGRTDLLKALDIAVLHKPPNVSLSSGKDRLFLSGTSDAGRSEASCASTGTIHMAYARPEYIKMAAKVVGGDKIRIRSGPPIDKDSKGNDVPQAILVCGADESLALITTAVPPKKDE